MTSTLTQDYMINYARNFTITYANITALKSSVDLLEQGALEPVSPIQSATIITVYRI